jgi:hypothetical protein
MMRGLGYSKKLWANAERGTQNVELWPALLRVWTANVLFIGEAGGPTVAASARKRRLRDYLKTMNAWMRGQENCSGWSWSDSL